MNHHDSNRKFSGRHQLNLVIQANAFYFYWKLVSSRRLLKAGEAIREVVASSILTELRDPRVRDVTVVGVKVSPDMREAKVSVSVMGDEAQQQLSLRGLQNAAGFLQSKIASRIDTRHTPRLQFVIDKGVQHSLLVGEILEKINRKRHRIRKRMPMVPGRLKMPHLRMRAVEFQQVIFGRGELR